MLRLWHNHQYHSRCREKSLRRLGAVIRNCSVCRATACRVTAWRTTACRATVSRATARVAPTIHGAVGPVVYGRGWACPSPACAWPEIVSACRATARVAPTIHGTPGRKSYQLSPSYESEDNSEHNGKY